MEIRFATKALEALYTEEKGAELYPAEVSQAYFDLLALIESAKDERELRALQGARFEKLKSERSRYSMRLTRQWRLEFEFDPPKGINKSVVIVRISKHYGD